jgi:hypothetical protein
VEIPTRFARSKSTHLGWNDRSFLARKDDVHDLPIRSLYTEVEQIAEFTLNPFSVSRDYERVKILIFRFGANPSMSPLVFGQTEL